MKGFLLSVLALIVVGGGVYFLWFAGDEMLVPSSDTLEGQVLPGSPDDTATGDSSDTDETDEQAMQNQPETQSDSDDPDATPPVDSSTEQEDASEEQDPPAPPRRNQRARTANEEQITFVDGAEAWVKQLRHVLDLLPIELMLVQGVPPEILFGEGVEVEISIHTEFDEFERLTDDLVVPDACSDAAGLVEEMTQRMASLRSSLSTPPTVQELQNAEPTRVKITERLNELYAVLNRYCQ